MTVAESVSKQESEPEPAASLAEDEITPDLAVEKEPEPARLQHLVIESPVAARPHAIFAEPIVTAGQARRSTATGGYDHFDGHLLHRRGLGARYPLKPKCEHFVHSPAFNFGDHSTG